MSVRSDSTVSARGSECPSTMTRGGWRIDSLVVASIQTSMDWTNKQKNLEAVKDLVAQAAQQQAQLILLPEAVGGYSYSKKVFLYHSSTPIIPVETT